MAKITIDREKCTNCKLCLETCPTGVFGLENGQVVVKNPDACIACKSCVMHCPHNAIKVEE